MNQPRRKYFESYYCYFHFIFAALKFRSLPDSIMVVRQILDLSVLVRIQVGQQVIPRSARGFVFSGSEPSLLE
jgi:hypothetical protein